MIRSDLLVRVATLSLLLLSAACAHYTPLAVQPESTAQAYQQRRLDDPALARYLAAQGRTLPTGAWDLDSLAYAALYFQPTLDVARADRAAALAAVITAGERPNPSLMLGPGFTPSAAGVANINPWILGYGFDLPLELPGARQHGIAQAQQLADAAQQQLAASAWRVRSGVRHALINLQAAQAASDLWRGQSAALTELTRDARLRAQVGEDSPLQAVQAQLLIDQAQLALQEADAAVQRALGGLATAIGVPAQALSTLQFSFESLDDKLDAGSAQAQATLPLPAARINAVTHRHDVLAALAEFAASDEALRLALARQYPSLHLLPGYTLDQGVGKWTLGLLLTLPVFNQNGGAIAEARARREAAAARFIAVQSSVLAEVEQALAAVTAAQATLATLNTWKQDSARQLQVLSAQLGVGEISRTDYNTALIDINRNTQALIEARSRAALALASLEDAMQADLPPAAAWNTAPRPTPNSNLPRHD